jgi:hypothetical protein
VAVDSVAWASRPVRQWNVAPVSALRDPQGPAVLAIFLVVQVLDGMLTYWGVTRFGIDLEMNVLLAATMHEMGPGPTLFAAKSLACACGLLLYVHAYLKPLAVVAGLCLGIAVIPWIMVAVWSA